MTAMADLLSRTLRNADPVAEQPSRPLPLTGLAAGGWAAFVGLVVCVGIAVVGWLAGSSGSAPGALRAGAEAWLLASGAALRLPAATVAVIPLGLTAGMAALLYRCGSWAGASAKGADSRAAVTMAAWLAGCYAVVAGVVGFLASTQSAAPDLVRTGLGALALAALSGGVGVARGAGVTAAAVAKVPAGVRGGARGALVGVAVMLALGTLLVLASLVAHLSTAVSMGDALGAGIVGGAVLVLLCLAVAPNAALCAVAFAVGPGFTAGAGTYVTPTGVRLGPLPDLPLLAALPADGRPGGWASALVLAPVLAGGAAAGIALHRSMAMSGPDTAWYGGLVGAASGAALGLLMGLARATGPGRLSDVGPRFGDCLLVCTAAMGLGGLLAGAAYALLRLHRAPGAEGAGAA
jgi:hypothetical protein